MSDSGGLDDVREGLRGSSGDPKFLIVMNAVLSLFFAWLVVWGLAFISDVTYTVVNVLIAAVIIFLLTFVVTHF